MAELRISPEAADDLREIRKHITVRLSASVTAQKLVSRLPVAGVFIVRVLHGKRDYLKLLFEEQPPQTPDN